MGETLEQALWREEAAEQADLLRWSDAVYLARAGRDPKGRGWGLTTVAPLLGWRPAARTRIRDHGPSTCRPRADPEGEVVVFAGRVGIMDDFWRPWRWGSWVVLGWRQKEAVVEPRIALRLRQEGQA